MLFNIISTVLLNIQLYIQILVFYRIFNIRTPHSYPRMRGVMYYMGSPIFFQPAADGGSQLMWTTHVNSPHTWVKASPGMWNYTRVEMLRL